MRDHRVSHMFASPSLLAALARVPAARKHEWPDLRALLVGGAPITDATALLAREFGGQREAFGPCGQWQQQRWQQRSHQDRERPRACGSESRHHVASSSFGGRGEK